MYRSNHAPAKSPGDIRFWDYSSKLRQLGFKHSVHALAYINLEAYHYVVDAILTGISMEMIMSGLHHKYPDTLSKMQMNGLGSLSPNSLLTFRREVENGNYLDINQELSEAPIHLSRLIKYANFVDELIHKVVNVEKRSGILTRLGLDLVKLGVEVNVEILKLQQQLALAK